MKKMLATLICGGCLAMVAAGSAWAGEINGRQARQLARIHQGVHSGHLTRAEARTLVREQHHFRHAKHRAWADGRLTSRERQRLHKMQRKAANHIYSLKHNPLRRW
jgi:hypothetical protein